MPRKPASRLNASSRVRTTWSRGDQVSARDMEFLTRAVANMEGHGVKLRLNADGGIVLDAHAVSSPEWSGIIWILNDMIDVLDDYNESVFGLVGDAPDKPVLTGWNAQGEWYGWVRGEYLVVRTDGEHYEDFEYDGEYEGLAYRFTDDFGGWDDSREKAHRIATAIEATTSRAQGWKLNKNTQGDIHVFPRESAAGDPGLFMVAPLMGWKRTSLESDWELMSVEDMIEESPTRLWSSFSEALDGEPTEQDPWVGLRPTWGHLRVGV